MTYKSWHLLAFASLLTLLNILLEGVAAVLLGDAITFDLSRLFTNLVFIVFFANLDLVKKHAIVVFVLYLIIVLPIGYLLRDYSWAIPSLVFWILTIIFALLTYFSFKKMKETSHG